MFLDSDLKDVMLEALRDAEDAFKAIDSNRLKSISDYTLHYAGIFQDSFSVSIAVVIYSLAKIVEKRKLRALKEWAGFRSGTLKTIAEARQALQRDDNKHYLARLKDLLASIGKFDEKFSEYLTEVIQKARIKKGSAVYEHGLSVGRAAELMGISPWELMEYLGHTKIMDEIPMMTMSVTERISAARKIFNLK